MLVLPTYDLTSTIKIYQTNIYTTSKWLTWFNKESLLRHGDSAYDNTTAYLKKKRKVGCHPNEVR